MTLFIDLRSMLNNDTHLRLVNELKKQRPSDASLSKSSHVGNGGRLFYSIKLTHETHAVVFEFLWEATLKSVELRNVLASHESWVVADKAHLIAEYFSPVVKQKPMQKWHRDVFKRGVFYALFINISNKNLNTHFKDGDVHANADTPILWYDTYETHAGPCRYNITNDAFYVKDRIQIFFSPSEFELRKGCEEQGVMNINTIQVLSGLHQSGKCDS